MEVDPKTQKAFQLGRKFAKGDYQDQTADVSSLNNCRVIATFQSIQRQT
jgi:hypothetical protein